MEKIDILRAMVRPVITLVFTFLLAAMFWTGRNIPDLLRYTWLAILAEWFGERFLLKLLNRKNEV